MARLLLTIFLAVFAARQAESWWHDCDEAVSFEPNHPNYVRNRVKIYNMTVWDKRFFAQRNLDDMDRELDRIYRDDRLDFDWSKIPQLSPRVQKICQGLISRSYIRSSQLHILELKAKYERLEASYDDLQKELKEFDPIVSEVEAYRGDEVLLYQAQSIYKHICTLAKMLFEEYSNHLESAEVLWKDYLTPAGDCIVYLPNDMLRN